jgi:hypothetical protein
MHADNSPSNICSSHVIGFRLSQEARVYIFEARVDDVTSVICQALLMG